MPLEATGKASSNTQRFTPCYFPRNARGKETAVLLSAKTHTAILSRLKQFQRKDQKSLGQPN